jgi:hypothetical protein
MMVSPSLSNVPQERPSPVVIGLNQTCELGQKSLAFGSVERLDQLLVGFIDGLLHVEQHDRALLGQKCAFGSTIVRVDFAANNPARFKARQHIRGRGPVNADLARNGDLVDSRLHQQYLHDAGLYRRCSKLGAFLRVNGEKDLVHAPNQNARSRLQSASIPFVIIPHGSPRRR